jgi:methionyl-tRNA synthetase
MENILLTTAISYTNGSPHIGHLYEAVIADFIKKIYEQVGLQVKLLTGTDEHGKKIQTTAQENQIEPIELCNKYSKEFELMNLKLGSGYDYFIRTTDQTHKELVVNSIKHILESQSKLDPIIYLGEYSGYYNVREECYVTETQASQTNYLDPITSKPYEIVKEPTYYFVQSKYLNEISNCIEQINPPDFREEIKSRLEKGLEDLSISRTGFTWGIKFPSDDDIGSDNNNIGTDNNDSTKVDSHVIYVWFDALLNYVTGKNILFGANNQNVKPVHLIGKDILWFHSVIYPAILKALGYENLMPWKILTHGFVLDKEGKKMSKSIGNVITNQELFDTYPVEAIRYYLITNTILGKDFKFDPDNLINSYNNILIKDFGNLFQRLLKIVKPIQSELNKYFEVNQEKIKNKKEKYTQELIKFTITWDFLEFNNLLSTIITHANKTLTDKKPWAIHEILTQVEILGEIMLDYNIGMCLMYPIIPDKVLQLAGYFGWDNKLCLGSNDINIKIDDSTNKIIAFESIKQIIKIQEQPKKNIKSKSLIA